MSRPVYSTPFIAWTSGGDEPTEYVVPEGFTAVVRDFTYWTGSPTVTAFIGFAETLGVDECWFAALTLSEDFSSSLWQGRVVLPAGFTLALNTGFTGDNDAVYVGGYLLSGDIPS